MTSITNTSHIVNEREDSKHISVIQCHTNLDRKQMTTEQNQSKGKNIIFPRECRAPRSCPALSYIHTCSASYLLGLCGQLCTLCKRCLVVCWGVLLEAWTFFVGKEKGLAIFFLKDVLHGLKGWVLMIATMTDQVVLCRNACHPTIVLCNIRNIGLC